MGRTRQRRANARANAESEAAGEIAALLAVGATLPTIASALLFLLPSRLLILSPDTGAEIADDVATSTTSRTSLLTNAEELLYRAYYAIRATRRIAARVLSSDPDKRREELAEALKAERANFQLHLAAQEARARGRDLNERMAARYGPVLSWAHLATASTHRRSHVEADGKNYDVRNPPRATGGMLPGMAPHCDCKPGPPKLEAEMMR